MKTKIKIKDGYILVKVVGHPHSEGGYVFQHRLEVEKKIKRYLNQEEKIHHIDENRQNNNIDNLMLFKNQKEHQSFHLKIKQFGITNPIKKQINERWENDN